MGEPRDHHPQSEKDKYCMLSLTCEIHNMTQADLYTKQKQILFRPREKICGCQEGGRVRKGWVVSLGLADANDYV